MSDDNFDDIFNGTQPEVTNDDPDTSTDQHEEVLETQEEASLEGNDTETEAHPEDSSEASEADGEPEDEKVNPHVPLPTFLGMKDKYRDEKAERIAAQEKADALQRQLEEYQKQAPKVSAEPDPFNDPKGYADYRFRELEIQRINDKIMMSGEFAKRTHGEEAVAEAAKWAGARAAQDPQFDAQVASQPDPMEWVIQQHKAARQLEDFQRDPEAFARRMAEEKGWLAQPAVNETATSTIQKERKLPKSMSDIPAANPAGRSKPVDETKGFNDLFN